MAPKKNLVENYDDGNLDLSLSEIQEIPVRDIAAIPKAIKLDLSCNTIVSLPKTFASSLTRLVRLDLSQNQITSLPENFGLLINLKHLDLDNNKLESLPLSFGNLKSLRWLDLKRNPLMPKLAEIAGQCLDAQQCQAAAKNVVAALWTMQEQVNEEINRRKEKQIKKLEKIEEKLKNEIKENLQQKKKKKKKGANATSNDTNSTHANGKTPLINKEEENNILNEENSNNLPSVPIKKTTKKSSFLGKVGSFLSSLLKFLVMSTFMVIFCGFLLSLFDEDLYIAIRKKTSETIQSNVPKEYLKYWDHGLLVTSKSVANWSSQVLTISVYWFNRLQDQLVALSSDEVVQQYLESIKSGWHIMWIWLSEAYTTVCAEMPNYFSSVKSFISKPFTNKL